MSKMQDKEETKLAGPQTVRKYQPNLKIDHISTFPDSEKDPNYVYMPVITNYKGAGANNFKEYEAGGWEVVYSTHGTRDDRAFTPETMVGNTSVPGPVLRVTREGYEEVYMRITKERYQENQMKNAIRDRKRYLAAVGTDPETGKPASSMNKQADGMLAENIKGTEFHINYK